MLFARSVYPIFESKCVLVHEVLIVQALSNHRIGDSQGENSIRSGIDRDPPVRFNRRRRSSRIDLHKQSPGTIGAAAQASEGLRGVHRPHPGLQQVGAKRKDKASLGEVIGQRSRYPLHQAVSMSGFFRGETAHADIVWSSVALAESLPEGVPVAPILSPQDHKRMREPFGPEIAQAGAYHRKRLIPADRAKATAVAITHHRSLQARCVVKKLKPSEGLRAKRAAVDRMKRIS